MKVLSLMAEYNGNQTINGWSYILHLDRGGDETEYIPQNVSGLEVENLLKELTVVDHVNVSAKSVNEIFQFLHDLTNSFSKRSTKFGSSPILAVDR